MKNIEYLSPTSISLWNKNKQEFYWKYLAENRPERFPQTEPMGVGSAFDAYIKCYLHKALFGNTDPKFEFENLFESQVEPQNRDFCRAAGQHIFDEYKAAGCIADLMLELRRSQNDPKFEFEIKGSVDGYRDGIKDAIGNLVLLGKPDLYYINHEGHTVILDFKVNGYCSKWGVSPAKGYLKLRGVESLRSKMHKECIPQHHMGMMINVSNNLEDINFDWAQQLTIYAWLTGMDVGTNFLIGIDQIVCKPGDIQPRLQFAEHRSQVSSNFQFKLHRNASEIWEIVHSDHIFRDMTKSESQEHCKKLDEMSLQLCGVGTPEDIWAAQMMRLL